MGHVHEAGAWSICMEHELEHVGMCMEHVQLCMEHVHGACAWSTCMEDKTRLWFKRAASVRPNVRDS